MKRISMFCVLATLSGSGISVGEERIATCTTPPLPANSQRVWRAELSRGNKPGDYAFKASIGPTHDVPAVPKEETFSVDKPITNVKGAVSAPRYEFDGGDLILEGAGNNFMRGSLFVKAYDSTHTYTMWCWNKNWQVTLRFGYQPRENLCRHVRGNQVGRNRFPLPYVRDTRDGECVDFVGDLTEAVGGTPILNRWRLAGANLSKAKLHSAKLVDADLRGTDMKNLDMKNAEISGTFDERTQLPDRAKCRVLRSGDVQRVTCVAT